MAAARSRKACTPSGATLGWAAQATLAAGRRGTLAEVDQEHKKQGASPA